MRPRIVANMHAVLDWAPLPIASARIALFRGGHSHQLSGVELAIRRLFGPAARVETFACTGLVTMDRVMNFVPRFIACTPEIIIAAGGGTVLDTAKAVMLRACIEPTERPWHIAIPTTCGHGSESTPFATVYDCGRKTSLEAPWLVPHVAVLDPALLAALPPAEWRTGSADTFCQSIESLWARGATPDSTASALAALDLLLAHWPAANPQVSQQAATALQFAAHLSGRAIAASRTTACHALSYAMSWEFGIPHGIAVSLTLPQVARVNAGAAAAETAPWLNALADRLACKGDPEALADALEAKLIAGGVPRQISNLGIAPAIFRERMRANDPNQERLANNPVALDAAAIEQILAAISK